MESANLTIKKHDILAKLAAINAEFHVNILSTELLVEDYSLSSALDLLSARVTEELNGEWNAAYIIQKISPIVLLKLHQMVLSIREWRMMSISRAAK